MGKAKNAILNAPVEVQRDAAGEASFSVSARVALQLGRESISSSITAILELIKNSYDADAEQVRIRFHELGTQRATLVIEDDGLGMSQASLKESWMVLGTAGKSLNPKTGKGRIVTGEKGLGRLGLDRLATGTKVQTKAKGATSATELDVDWTKYEAANTALEAVKHKLYTLQHLDFDPITGVKRQVKQGTRLILTGLKDTWNEETIGELRKEIGLLLSPFAGPKDFGVSVDSGMKWKSVDGPVTVPKFVLEAATWKVVGKLTDAGKVTIAMTSRHTDRAYHLSPTVWSDWVKGADEKPACGPLRFEFYFFPRKEVTLDEQTLGRSQLNTFLDSNQGIRIFRDRFRVKPYGAPDGSGDWLRLSFRKTISPAAVSRVGDWRVAYNQLVGAAFIGRENNPNLADQTNREGLVEGPGFRDLKIFARKVIEYFELNHSEFESKKREEQPPIKEIQRESEDRARASVQALERLAKALDKLPTPKSPTDSKPLAVVRSAMSETMQALVSSQEAVRLTEKRTEELLEKAKEEKNTMANLASLGILNVAFGHETLGLTDVAAKNAVLLRDRIVEDAILLLPDYKLEALQSLNDLSEATHKIETFAKFSLVTISPTKRRKQRLSLSEVIKDVFATFKNSLDERNIETDLRLSENADIRIRAYASDWDSILVNLITNSVWAMESTRKGQRKIRVTLTAKEETAILRFEDSGKGLEAKTEQQVFLPTFSTKRNERGESIGTGMGLAILKSCVEENSGGSVSAKARGALGGALFEIRVPRAKST